MARNNLGALLLGLGLFYYLTKGKKGTPVIGGNMLTTWSMNPTTYYYRTVPQSFEEHIQSGISSTTPGYHPTYQSAAIEKAVKTRTPVKIVTRAPVGVTKPISYSNPEIQTRIAAYKQYAALRK